MASWELPFLQKWFSEKNRGNFCLNYFANSMLEFSRLPWLIAMLGTSRLDVVNTTVGNG